LPLSRLSCPRQHSLRSRHQRLWEIDWRDVLGLLAEIIIYDLGKDCSS